MQRITYTLDSILHQSSTISSSPTTLSPWKPRWNRESLPLEFCTLFQVGEWPWMYHNGRDRRSWLGHTTDSPQGFSSRGRASEQYWLIIYLVQRSVVESGENHLLQSCHTNGSAEIIIRFPPAPSLVRARTWEYARSRTSTQELLYTTIRMSGTNRPRHTQKWPRSSRPLYPPIPTYTNHRQRCSEQN